MSYFRYTEFKGVLEKLDSWINRKLRCHLLYGGVRGR
ncbi:group II intron maturase-specific domain-containing protein [Moellerella wisconsensis]|uniref:Uncharacterized protein n=2 Tax=Moellerella wisconsensis TaxID=158849 RepID=A0ACD3YDE3_9GAMM|nr:group II intron maturase-specific domain-containing protein [Moellerella wisconsensis]UNH25699.1 hypothetical protein MNY68_08955 [Moellerella wisconsensis]UNH28838.1 hypothetical protein MNY64_09530 [Moellerella wisconsensis]UNH32296.1 hypothetical protein MNY72_09090 [Moellerella wisconsensis]UNH40469.1 hypothetical protein MNY70_09110 [Moellerella wisconsensis]UNH43970.1 hypothetical protein MNY66_09130 [Moellerella wisconsensis]